MARQHQLLALALCVISIVSPRADAAEPRLPKASFNIESQPLGDALNAFAQQSGLQVVFYSAIGEGLVAPRLSGEFSPQAALDQLLANTSLSYEFADARSVIIRAKGMKGASLAEGQGSATASATSSSAAMRLVRSSPASSATGKAEQTKDEGREAAKESERQIDEVIVTATKRVQNVRDVPLSIAVVGNQDIERRGLIGMEDYLRSIPGVNQIDRGGQDNAIVIRGITTSPEFENFTSAPTVATYFDETPITGAAGRSAGGIDVRPVDIDRIEVLRGPQGTAYGSASLGGALRIIPAKPKLDGFAAKVAASYSDTGRFGDDNSMIQAVFNVPLVIDKLAVRAVGYRYDESGYYRNVAGSDPAFLARAQGWGIADSIRGYVQDDIGRMVSTGGRLSALWQPTDRLNLSLTYLTQKIEQDGRPVAYLGTYEQTQLPLAPDTRARGETGEVADTDIDLASLVVNYDFGWATLTSATSSIDSGSQYSVDYTGLLGFPISVANPSDFKSFTSETRLASKLDGRFQFLGGLFYEDVDEEGSQLADGPGAPAPNPFRTNPMYTLFNSRQLYQRAVFGELSYDLTSKITATVGARYFDYDKDDRLLREGGAYNVPYGTGVLQIARTQESGVSRKANLSYKPAKDALLYASWSEGFRLGRPTAGVPSVSCDTNGDGLLDGTTTTIESTTRINSDFLDNYELGGKFSLLDRRVVIDTAVYHIDWNGLPITTLAGTCPVSYVANVGAATSEGAEFQASVFATEGLRFDFGAGYTKAELAKDAPRLPGSPKKGARLPASPEISANLAAQYDFSVVGYKAFVRADSFYVGKFYGDLLEQPLTAAGDYIKVDTRAGVAIRNLSVEIFVRNLTNEDAFTWRGLSNANSSYGYRLRPRTFGIQLGYTFE